MFFTPPNNRPREVTDCSSLLRFAYREALRQHDAEWARSLRLEWLPPLPELRNPVRRPDLFVTSDGSPRQFADAEHLMRHNTRKASSDATRAAPGDLLFYRQLVDSEPWHTMIHLGRSAFDQSPGPFVVYHTGPLRGRAGEVRRPALRELLNHPEPRWRPVAGNPNFLGVYRWNILTETD